MDPWKILILDLVRIWAEEDTKTISATNSDLTETQEEEEHEDQHAA